MTLSVLPKGRSYQLSSNFESTEFDCPCINRECVFTYIDLDLITKLQSLRDIVRVPLFINSGFRCTKHQLDLKERGHQTASLVSSHEHGMAADIFTIKHTGLELEEMARDLGFKAVGVGESWIHVDLRRDKHRRWEYHRA